MMAAMLNYSACRLGDTNSVWRSIVSFGVLL
jgi:hypothetical protein